MERHVLAFGLCVTSLAAGVYSSLPVFRIPYVPPVSPIPPAVRPFLPFEPSPAVAPSAATATTPDLFSPVALPPITVEENKADTVSATPEESAGAQSPVSTDDVTGVSVTKPTIVQISITGCQPCVLFMENEKHKYTAVGWDVIEVKDKGIDMPRYPSYRIFGRGKWHTHVGKLTPQALRFILGMTTTAAPLPAEVQYTPTVVIDDSPFYGVDYTINGRAWTEASLRSHLYTSSNHRHPYGSLDGMSLSQLQRLHTDDHENRRPVAASRQYVYRRYSSSGSCPTGSCPTN